MPEQTQDIGERAAQLEKVLWELLNNMSGMTDGCGCCSERSGYEYESFKEAAALIGWTDDTRPTVEASNAREA